jgi:hypothetical protein
MEQLYFYVFEVIMLFCISSPNWPVINTFRTVEDREIFSGPRVDRWVQKFGHLCPIATISASFLRAVLKNDWMPIF